MIDFVLKDIFRLDTSLSHFLNWEYYLNFLGFIWNWEMH